MPPTYAVGEPFARALEVIDRADNDLRRLEVDRDRTRHALRDAIARNVQATARMGGNPLTLEEVARLLRTPPRGDQLCSPGEFEVLNCAAFLTHLDQRRMPREPGEVAEVHQAMFGRVLDAPGRFRRKGTVVGWRVSGEAVYVPTAPAHIQAELAEALDWLRHAQEHPLLRAMVFCHEVASIHPFPDGNGRLARAMMLQFLWHHGYRGVRYPLLACGFNQDRAKYGAMLAAARGPGWDRSLWLAYVARVFVQEYGAAVQRFLVPEELPGVLNDRQRRLAVWFARRETVWQGRRWKLAEIQAAFREVPRRTLQADLARLAEAGVVTREGVQKGTTYGLGRAATRGSFGAGVPTGT